MRKMFFYPQIYCNICKSRLLIIDVGFSENGVVRYELYCEICEMRIKFDAMIEVLMARAAGGNNPELVSLEETKTIH